MLRSRSKITFTSLCFSRMSLCLPVRYIPSGMLLTGNSQNLFGIFRETCQVYFLTAPKNQSSNCFIKSSNKIELFSILMKASIMIDAFTMKPNSRSPGKLKNPCWIFKREILYFAHIPADCNIFSKKVGFNVAFI